MLNVSIDQLKLFFKLLAVLPPASKNLLPHCYHDLMTKDSSLIKQYYPENFQTDLNGKKQEWEAVVLVPFIDEVSHTFFPLSHDETIFGDSTII